MPFELNCNQCGTMIRVNDDEIGSIINCSGCGQVILVQSPDANVPASSSWLRGEPEFAAPGTTTLTADATRGTVAEFLRSMTEAGDVAAGVSPAASDSQRVPITGPPSGPTTGSEPITANAVDLVFSPLADDTIAGEKVSSANGAEPATPSPFEVAARAAAPVPFSLADSAVAHPVVDGPVVPNARPSQATIVSHEAPARADAASAPPQFDSYAPRQIGDEYSTTGRADTTSTRTARSAENTAKRGARYFVPAVAYLFGVLMGLLVGKVIFGGTSGAAAGPTGLEMICDDGLHKHPWPSPHSAVPRSQIRRIGEAVRVGGLEVTATSVERRRVTKVHAATGNEETSQDECLVLRLVLRNVSTNLRFAPLDPAFVRPLSEGDHPTYSFIELKNRESIPLFLLATFSEFDLAEQSFEEVQPGEQIESIVAAAEGSPAQVRGKMLWRVRVRAGEYKGHGYSTVVGFEFTPEQIRG